MDQNYISPVALIIGVILLIAFSKLMQVIKDRMPGGKRIIYTCR